MNQLRPRRKRVSLIMFQTQATVTCKWPARPIFAEFRGWAPFRPPPNTPLPITQGFSTCSPQTSEAGRRGGDLRAGRTKFEKCPVRKRRNFLDSCFVGLLFRSEAIYSVADFPRDYYMQLCKHRCKSYPVTVTVFS